MSTLDYVSLCLKVIPWSAISHYSSGPQFLISESRVFVPCRMVIEWYQDLGMKLSECGMWIQDPVSECWKVIKM
jgi:hypothetical protein